jgi:hypothetical protein
VLIGLDGDVIDGVVSQGHDAGDSFRARCVHSREIEFYRAQTNTQIRRKRAGINAEHIRSSRFNASATRNDFVFCGADEMPAIRDVHLHRLDPRRHLPRHLRPLLA